MLIVVVIGCLVWWILCLVVAVVVLKSISSTVLWWPKVIVLILWNCFVSFVDRFLGNCIDKQKLTLQEKLNKACVEDAELQAEELTLIKRTSFLHEKRCAFLFREFCLYKQLGILNEKEKKMFARELVSIKDLERSEWEASEGVRASNALEVSKSIVNPLNDLFNSFSLLAFTFSVNIP